MLPSQTVDDPVNCPSSHLVLFGELGLWGSVGVPHPNFLNFHLGHKSRTDLLPEDGASLPDHILIVFCGRPLPEVVGSATNQIVAGVAHLELIMTSP